ncbi:MAG: SPOR domain-containing protein [Gammaproteobacteria bacterium]|nr:SPOR domain-containing protein [Gammaproteobacteria bacterium]
MPRDYADSTSPSKKPGQLPGWLWMLGGLTIGLFVAFLVYLNNHTPTSARNGLGKTIEQTIKQIQPQAASKPSPPATPSIESKTSPPTADTKPAPKFDFYYILPELEVAVPDQELAKAASGKDKSPDSNTAYILQAASFKSHEEADRLKAKLALNGVEATIQSVTINNDTWHRVRVGPIKDISLLNKTRRRLQDNGITAIVVKAK